MEVLLLCTGNICRSPMAAGLLTQHLRRQGLDAAVRSAGRSGEGLSPPPQAVAAGAGRGLDLSGHRSQAVTAALVGQADLVVGMAREHVRDAVALDPDAFPRAFTLKELVRRGEVAGARRAGEGIRDWAERVGAGRSASALLGSARADDVVDPVGGPPRAYRRTLQELDALTGRLAELLAGPT